MINVKLLGHDFRYEAYQILSLFYTKQDINFSEEDCDMESVYDNTSSFVECKFTNSPIKYKLTVNNDEKKSVKNAIKMTMLKCLQEYTGVTMPWGILVGIRPTKIVHDYLNTGFTEAVIKSNLQNYYSLSEVKSNLVYEVALNERKFLKKNKNDIGIYVGIPFCPTRCVYCSFTSNPIGGNNQLVEDYLGALNKEINEVFSFIKTTKLNVDTFYMGGGTPTSLSADNLDMLLSNINCNIKLSNLREVTIEAGRPDSIDMDKLKVIRSNGCSRISINPQTMNDATLNRIGRKHSTVDIKEKFYMAKELGFNNVNMDMIIGLPGEGEEELLHTLNELENLSPESITIHTMAIKRASKLNEEAYEATSNATRMYDIASERVRGMGMYPYYMYRQKNMVAPLENIGYCKKDMECIYNIQMIAENIPIISFGADAITKIIFEEENRIERVANLKDVREYITRIDEMISNKIEAIRSFTL